MSNNAASGMSSAAHPTSTSEGGPIQKEEECIDATPNATQRNANNDTFDDKLANLAGSDDMALSSSPPSKDRRMSKEWDAAKVPPSRFQRREGSIFSTPGSRDGHVRGSGERDKAYHDKLKEKGWTK